MAEPKRSSFRVVGIPLVVVLFGIPTFLYFSLITNGALLAPLFGFALMAPFLLLNYAVWGWHSAFKPAARSSISKHGQSLGASSRGE